MSEAGRECVAADFEVGDRVEMTKRALDQGLLGRAVRNRGTVLAVQSPLRIKVRRYGIKTPSWYYAGFWRPL